MSSLGLDNVNVVLQGAEVRLAIVYELAESSLPLKTDMRGRGMIVTTKDCTF
jgi:hypothetical protein